jgi:hypothetical protein
MDIKINIKLSDDTAEIKAEFENFKDAMEHIRWLESMVLVSGGSAERVHELINF